MSIVVMYIGMLATGSRGDHDASLARHLAEALLSHDRSIRSAQVDEVLVLEVGLPTATTRRSAHCFDEHGRWAVSYVDQLRGSEGEEVVNRGRLVFDGNVLYAFADDQKEATIRTYNGERRGRMGIDRWLGRHTDEEGQHHLGELLLASRELRFSGFSESGLPVLCAPVDLRGPRVMLEVEVDPSHGFAPRSITVRDLKIRVPYFHFETLEFTLVHDVWLPTRGRLTTRNHIFTKGQHSRFEAALRARGLTRESDSFDPAVREGFLAAMRESFGAEEGPSEELTPPMEISATFQSLNQPLDPDMFKARPPESWLVFDAIRNIYRRPNTKDWIENGAAR